MTALRLLTTVLRLLRTVVGLLATVLGLLAAALELQTAALKLLAFCCSSDSDLSELDWLLLSGLCSSACPMIHQQAQTSSTQD